jgi:hypothetical protein
MIVVAFIVEPAGESVTRHGQLASHSGLRMGQLRGESRAFGFADQIFISQHRLEYWIDHHLGWSFLTGTGINLSLK